MAECKYFGDVKDVGFVSTRLAGTDGVSLETAKWARVFESEGFKCFYFGGELDRAPGSSYLVPEAHFTHPEIKDIKPRGFDVIELPGYVTAEAVAKTKALLEDPERVGAAVDRNYEIGRCFFSFEVLERQLKHYFATHMALKA